MAAPRSEGKLRPAYLPERRSALYQWQRRMQTRVGNALLLWMARRFRGLPGPASLRVGEALGSLARVLSPRHYAIVMTNLRIAFGGEKEESELRRLASACYRHLGKSLMEFIRLPAFTRDDIKRLVELRGKEHLEAALAAGKGAILLTAHLGNWEMIGARIAAEGYRLSVIARAQRDDALTGLLRGTREVTGMRVLHQEVAVMGALRALRRNEVVGILLDQNAGDDGVFVDFFGRPASTAAGAALFALRTGAAVLPSFGWRLPDNTHVAVMEPALPLISTGDQAGDVRANTAQYTRAIEEHIRAHPEQWFWLHKRWKSRPPEERGG